MKRWLLMLALLGAAACPPPNPPHDAGTPGPCLDRPGNSNAPSDQLPCELYPPR